MTNEQKKDQQPDFSGMLTPEFVSDTAKNIFAGHEDVGSAIIGLSPEEAVAVNTTLRMAMNQPPLTDRPPVDLSKVNTGIPMTFDAPTAARPQPEDLAGPFVPGVIGEGMDPAQVSSMPLEKREG